MLLPALKFLERIEVRVAIAQAHDEAERNLTVGLMIEKAATICVS